MKLNKTLLLIPTFFAIFNAPMFAQNCKHVVEKKDEFTKLTTRSAKIGFSSDCAVQMQRDADKATMGFYIQKFGVIDAKLTAGHKVLFKLENDEVIELVLDKDCPPTAQRVGSNVYTSWWFTVPVDDAFYKKFTKSPVTAIRTSIGGLETTVRVKEKAGSALMDTFICMLRD